MIMLRKYAIGKINDSKYVSQICQMNHENGRTHDVTYFICRCQMNHDTYFELLSFSSVQLQLFNKI